jgi:hypothetical protein
MINTTRQRNIQNTTESKSNEAELFERMEGVNSQEIREKLEIGAKWNASVSTGMTSLSALLVPFGQTNSNCEAE